MCNKSKFPATERHVIKWVKDDGANAWGNVTWKYTYNDTQKCVCQDGWSGFHSMTTKGRALPTTHQHV